MLFLPGCTDNLLPSLTSPTSLLHLTTSFAANCKASSLFIVVVLLILRLESKVSVAFSVHSHSLLPSIFILTINIFPFLARAISLWVDRPTNTQEEWNSCGGNNLEPLIKSLQLILSQWTGEHTRSARRSSPPPSGYSSGLSLTLLGWHFALVDPVTFLHQLVPLIIMWFFWTVSV